MEESIACFCEIFDPRQKNIRHNLYEVLVIFLCTLLCAGEDCSDLDFPHFSSGWPSGHNPEDILVGDEA